MTHKCRLPIKMPLRSIVNIKIGKINFHQNRDQVPFSTANFAAVLQIFDQSSSDAVYPSSMPYILHKSEKKIYFNVKDI